MPRTEDLDQIRSILQADPGWTAYAMADLAPGYREHCEWHVTATGGPALVLIYRAFDVPVLFALGSVDTVRTLLPEIANERELYVAVRPELVPVIRAGYSVNAERQMWRMVLDPHRFEAPRDSVAFRLQASDFPALRELYAEGVSAGEMRGFFDETMLQRGAYWGVREGNAIIAAAGTHIVATTENVAAIGNVYTRRDRRKRGLATLTTAAVTADLLRLGIRTIALNVEANNTGAIRIYERLGFGRHCNFTEGLAAKN